MRVAVTGATGLIGSALAEALVARGDQVIALSRNADTARVRLGDRVEVHTWADPMREPPPRAALSGADAIVHLLGEPVSQRWSSATKQAIRDSRVLTTRQLVATLRGLDAAERPQVLVSQSAAGYYGPCADERVDESGSPGADFLAEVVVAWEAEAQGAADLLRVALARTGVVLSPSGGALAKMLAPFRLGIGGPVAGGRQYVPWIHLDDVTGALTYCLDHPSVSGPVNLTAPAPVRNRELSKALGRALHRPAVLPVPGLALQLLYGEMAQIITTGQRVVPGALENYGYAFVHPEIEAALRDVLARR
ncbi:MAG: TIGR01777 family oxidoreductase [Solirubrobacteraceae bacterium]